MAIFLVKRDKAKPVNISIEQQSFYVFKVKLQEKMDKNGICLCCANFLPLLHLEIKNYVLKLALC